MKKQIVSICWFVLAMGIAMFAGCMVGPEYSRPKTAADTPDGYFQAGEHSQDVNDLAGVDRWWEQFGDPTTAVLVQQMLENNYDLKAAAARVLQAQAALAETHGRFWPDVS